MFPSVRNILASRKAGVLFMDLETPHPVRMRGVSVGTLRIEREVPGIETFCDERMLVAVDRVKPEAL